MFTIIPFSDFQERTGVKKTDLTVGEDTEQIVSLRQLSVIKSVQVMPLDYLLKILKNATFQNKEVNPYKDCDIVTVRMDPNSLQIGQTFIQRDKYRSFLENFQDIFKNFCVTKGIAKCTALIAFGETAKGVPSVAHYIPPIVEENDGQLCLLDGVHRNFLVKMIGTTLETIVIKKVRYQFPCELQNWQSIKVVDEKPPKEKRFFNLQPELFRDLNIVGIDG